MHRTYRRPAPAAARPGRPHPRTGAAEQLTDHIDRPAWAIERGAGPVVAVALHNGHDVRPEVAELMVIDDDLRRREEDPYTERFTRVADNRVVVHRSRFEIDLNRPKETAICDRPDDCWNLELWRRPLPERVTQGSRDLHDRFYEEVTDLLEDLQTSHGGAVVLDLHAYNHRRNGPDGPPGDPETHPDVNVGTGSMNRDRWGHLVDRFIAELTDASGGLDVRENVKFQGRQLARHVHETFPATGCCLAVEFKKTFMDEHTGEIDIAKQDALIDALAATIPGLVSSLREVV